MNVNYSHSMLFNYFENFPGNLTVSIFKRLNNGNKPNYQDYYYYYFSFCQKPVFLGPVLSPFVGSSFHRTFSLFCS